MKQLSTVLNGVLLIAVIILFVLHFKSTGTDKNTSAADGQSAGGEFFPVAYINTDSLLLHYTFAKEVNEQLMSKEEASRADFNEKARVFQQDAVEFQRKVQNNGFLSMERAQKEQQRLAKAEQDLAQLNQTLTNELMREQEKLNRQLRDTLINYLEEYNKQKPYKVILSNTLGDNVLYGAAGVDITNEIVEVLNARHAASKK
ncbi:OmpH family outer membrane protein [Carboxylicivirga sediminis]|uniref:OmpH family outer membrane protein n=1 Tax=Carboxylicivirga sediminis TaxID=2006564 RepID=A0A941F928_9BACT|nr:OmpH family outer membrane protein [Carboxylicivirga sediminis]MBR8537565.1 OmpH family outer membrane protein [Carboxylicivirga sediminis]